MSLVRKILYAFGAVLLLVIAVGVFLPSTLHVARETRIDAHPATVFALINDLRRTLGWSPWSESAPDARVEFSGPPTGVGATMRREGDAAGRGSQSVVLTIIESTRFERVVYSVDLGDDTAVSTIGLSEDDGGTLVRWWFDIDFGNDLLARYSRLFLTGSIGAEYERGLSNLESLAESLPRADFSNLEIESLVVEPIDIAYRRTTSQPDAAAISSAMGDAFFNVLSFMDRHGLEEAGPPLAITRTFSGSELVFDAAIPVDGLTAGTPDTESGVQIGTTYGGPVVRARHVGSYRDLGRTHEKVAAYLAAHGIERNGDVWEAYVSDPTRTAEARLVTYVYYPVKMRSNPAADIAPR